MAELIGSIADALLRTDLAHAPAAARAIMRQLVEHFGVDAAFLRLHDHQRRTTMLYAEWPPRVTAPGVDPLEVTHFDRAGPVIAMEERLKEPLELHDDTVGEPHYELLAESGVARPRSLLFVPVLSAKGTTSGVIGLASRELRQWTHEHRTTLATVASMLELTRARFVAELKLSRGAHRDPLTNLPDRAALLSHLADRLSGDDDDAPVVALMVRFSDVAESTERLGLDAGDEFIAAAADRLRVALLGSASLFHTGTAEFVAVPFSGTTSDARRMAVGLQSVLESPQPLRGQVVMPRINVGIASEFRDSPNPAALLRGLRQAVTHAQRDSGTAISVLSRHIVRTARRRDEIEAGIRDAIVDGTLHVEYQPEVDIRTREMVGMEALVRWRHPTLGELPPESFLDVVESMNLTGELGRYVLRTASADLSRWQHAGLASGMVMRVNVSPLQLVDPGFVDGVAAVLAEFGLGHGALCVEFTETVVFHDADSARSLVEGLQRIGVKVAIDDFGTGYSGFARLKALPVDAVKIDRSFVRDVDVNLHDRAIVAAVTAMAASFEIDVVAEGVETEGAAATLVDLGCRYAQGFLFSRPVDADAMRQLLEASEDRPAEHVPR